MTRYFDAKLPKGTPDPALWAEVQKYEATIAEKLERAELRDAFREIFELSSFANKYFQDAEPWRLRNENPEKAKAVIRDLAYIVRDLAVLIEPYIPAASAKIASFFGIKPETKLTWKDIGKPEGIPDETVLTSEVLFSKLESDMIDILR
jgi:methionyl-tRNA synthetase